MCSRYDDPSQNDVEPTLYILCARCHEGISRGENRIDAYGQTYCEPCGILIQRRVDDVNRITGYSASNDGLARYFASRKEI